MPITRMTYESKNGLKQAVIFYIDERRWSIDLRRMKTGSAYVNVGVKEVKTLTSAQGVARRWVG